MEPDVDRSARGWRRTALWSGTGVIAIAVVVGVVLAARGASPASSGSATPSATVVTPGPASPAPSSTTAEPGAPSVSSAGDGTPSASASGEAEQGARPTSEPVPLTDTAAPVSGVDAVVTSIEAVQGQATRPGEIAGPALRFTLEVRNRTDQAVDLSAAVVNLYVGPEAAPAGAVQEPGARAFPPAVASGQVATGVWVFTVPEAERGDVSLELDLGVSSSVVLFRGSAS